MNWPRPAIPIDGIVASGRGSRRPLRRLGPWRQRHCLRAGRSGGLGLRLARRGPGAPRATRVSGLVSPSLSGTRRNPAWLHGVVNTTLGIYGHRDQTDLETAMEAYARCLEQERENGIVPPEADR
jgi:hypothetical protein